MKPDILAKLTEELHHEITSERQVVYLLLELRKLMELNGDTEKESPYDTLTFCCDWVAHPLLDRRRAQRIVEQFDKYESFFEAITNVKNGQKVGCEIDFFRDFTETLKLAKCSEQLREHPENHELDSSIARDDNM